MFGKIFIYHDTPLFRLCSFNWRVVFLLALSFQALAVDDAKHIASLHAENWRQTLLTGNVEEVLGLYDPGNALLIGPNGALAGSLSEMAAFWRSFIDKGGVKTNIQVVDAHFDVLANQRQDSTVVARLLLSRDNSDKPNRIYFVKQRWHVDSILKRQTNGQWKTQLQNWY